MYNVRDGFRVHKMSSGLVIKDRMIPCVMNNERGCLLYVFNQGPFSEEIDLGRGKQLVTFAGNHWHFYMFFKSKRAAEAHREHSPEAVEDYYRQMAGHNRKTEFTLNWWLNMN